MNGLLKPLGLLVCGFTLTAGSAAAQAPETTSQDARVKSGASEKATKQYLGRRHVTPLVCGDTCSASRTAQSHVVLRPADRASEVL